MNMQNIKNNLIKLSQNSLIQRIAVVVIILAIAGGIWYFYPQTAENITSVFSGKLPRGGEYETLSKDHPRGEEFKGYVEKAYDKLENTDEADDASSYLDVGFYKNELGDKDGAIDAYEAGIEKYPRHEIMIANLAHIYEDIKEYDKAEIYYKKNIEINPQNIRIIIDLANLYRFYMPEKKGEILPLVEQRGLTINPNEPNLMNYLAYYYRYELKNRDKALEYYQKLIALDPDNMAIKVELNNLLLQPIGQ